MLILLLAAGCSEKLSVEQQIIATIRNMETAAEDGEHLEFMGFISKSFTAQQGSMNRSEFHRFMIFQINQNRRLQAQIFPIYVQETGVDRAAANFRILVTGGAGLLPERGQLYEVETHWLSDGSDWELEKADWVVASLTDLPLD
jgi:hypothetical protein